jgi:hypothetical protein
LTVCVRWRCEGRRGEAGGPRNDDASALAVCGPDATLAAGNFRACAPSAAFETRWHPYNLFCGFPLLRAFPGRPRARVHQGTSMCSQRKAPPDPATRVLLPEQLGVRAGPNLQDNPGERSMADGAVASSPPAEPASGSGSSGLAGTDPLGSNRDEQVCVASLPSQAASAPRRAALTSCARRPPQLFHAAAAGETRELERLAAAGARLDWRNPTQVVPRCAWRTQSNHALRPRDPARVQCFARRGAGPAPGFREGAAAAQGRREPAGRRACEPRARRARMPGVQDGYTPLMVAARAVAEAGEVFQTLLEERTARLAMRAKVSLAPAPEVRPSW